MKKNKEYKNTKYCIDGHHHGLFIKEARLRKKYCLVKVAEGVCSFSYLSKIESGKSTPKPRLFSKLVEKLEIQFPTGVHRCPIGVFRKALYQEDLCAITSLISTDTFHHYEIQMLNFFQAVINNELSKADDLKKMIDQFCYYFNLKEKQTYMLFLGIYFFKKLEWKKGNKNLGVSLKLMHQIKEEDPYLYFELAKYYFQIQKEYLGFSYLKRATKEFKKILEKNWVFKCGILWCKEAMRHDEDIENIERQLEELRKIIDPCKDSLQWSYFFNILGMICEKRGQNNQAAKYFKKSIEPRDNEISEELIIDEIKFNYRRQNRDQVIKLIERQDYNFLSDKNRTILDFYYLKITAEESEDFEIFLRKGAIPLAMEQLDTRNAFLYTKELVDYHKRRKCYRKATDARDKLEKYYKEWNIEII